MKYLVIFVIAILSYPALAQWEKYSDGMEDLTAYRLAGKDGRLMVGTLSGFTYFSSDTAKNWTARNLGLHNYKFTQLTSSTGYLYFAASDHFNGIFRSSDGGNRWRWYKSPGPFQDEYPFLSVSTNDSLVLAGTLSKGVWIRRNDQQKTEGYYGEANGLPKFPIYATAIFGDTLYAGSWGKGLYRSIDTGNTWVNKSDGLTSLHIHSILVRGNLIIAGTERGIYRSTDYGDTWTDVSNSKTKLPVLTLEFFYDFVLAGTSENGIFLSEDDGKTWAGKNVKISNQKIYSIEAVGDKVFAGTCGGGVLFSADSSKTWEPRNTGLPNLFVGSVTHFGNRIIVGLLHDLVYASDDDGKTWNKQQVWIDGPCGMPISSLYMDENMIYAGTDGTGIYRSSDNGRHWEAKSVGLENYAITSIIKHQNILYAGTEGKGIYCSIDNGKRWFLKDTTLFGLGIDKLVSNGNKLFAVTGGYIYTTDNIDGAWDTIARNYEYGGIVDMETSGRNLILVTTHNEFKGRIFVSIDNGKSWIQKLDSLTIGNSATSNMATDNNICLIYSARSLLFSSNSGIDWIIKDCYQLTPNDVLIMGDEAFVASSFYGEGCEGYGVFKAKLSDLLPTAVTDIPNQASFSISPNPATDYIEIRFAEGYKTGMDHNIRIYDAFGRCLMNSVYKDTDILKIDVSGFPSGLYLLNFRGESHNFIKI